MTIASFTGSFRFLSNFYPCRVEFEGHTYPSVEHAYVAAKTLDPDLRDLCRGGSAGEVKRIGRRFNLRPDWEEIKLCVMEDLLRKKFGQEPFYSLLLSTETEELIEGNNWGDTYWGVCKGRGENHLGKLLMKIRQDKQ